MEDLVDPVAVDDAQGSTSHDGSSQNATAATASEASVQAQLPAPIQSQTILEVAEQGKAQPHQPPQGDQHPLEVEVQDDDADSALGSEVDERSLSTSLASSIRHFKWEHGRSYHSYKEGQYAYPNDEIERDRLDLQHHLFRLTFDQKLYLAPIKKDCHRVLDIGTGTGLWAIEFAEEHPSAEVIGTDLSPIQPDFTPPNLSFLIDDASEPWIFKHKFDFIHSRQLHCAVPERHLLREAYENLEPGGWIEMQDLSFPVGNDDGTVTEDHAIWMWSAWMLEASKRMGRPLDNPAKYPAWMQDAGFVNVHYVPYKWPSCPWPKDEKHKTLGLWNQFNTLDGLDGFTMASFTRWLGWTPEEVNVFLIGVRRDTKNRGIHNYWPIHVTYGQKPYE